jgi:hypothetical protein
VGSGINKRTHETPRDTDGDLLCNHVFVRDRLRSAILWFTPSKSLQAAGRAPLYLRNTSISINFSMLCIIRNFNSFKRFVFRSTKSIRNCRPIAIDRRSSDSRSTKDRKQIHLWNRKVALSDRIRDGCDFLYRRDQRRGQDTFLHFPSRIRQFPVRWLFNSHGTLHSVEYLPKYPSC